MVKWTQSDLLPSKPIMQTTRSIVQCVDRSGHKGIICFGYSMDSNKHYNECFHSHRRKKTTKAYHFVCFIYSLEKKVRFLKRENDVLRSSASLSFRPSDSTSPTPASLSSHNSYTETCIKALQEAQV